MRCKFIKTPTDIVLAQLKLKQSHTLSSPVLGQLLPVLHYTGSEVIFLSSAFSTWECIAARRATYSASEYIVRSPRASFAVRPMVNELFKT